MISTTAPPSQFVDDTSVMQRALELARTGAGAVEPNPCVGAVIVDSNRRFLGEGFHECFGGPHAEVMALRQAGPSAAGATLFVTLEPCHHQGQTPPCTEAVIAAGIRRVVVAVADPAIHSPVSGVDRLKAAGIDVTVGLCEEEAEELIAPFKTLTLLKRPYVHAKWAMTLDGKLATRTGSSKWVSSDLSRARVHELRGRVDGILTGIGTVLADDPLLTARPSGPRVATRIILDSLARLPLESQLVKSVAEAPVLLVTTPDADEHRRAALVEAGVEVLECVSIEDDSRCDIVAMLKELGSRRFTNLLLEGGGGVLGEFWDHQLVDEIHCFIAPKIVGGESAMSPFGGMGLELMPQQSNLIRPHVEMLEQDVYWHARVERGG